MKETKLIYEFVRMIGFVVLPIGICIVLTITALL